MTSISTSRKVKPFLLRPAGKDYLWGGNRLQTEFNKEIPLTPLAETWECSTHPDGPSIAASGEYAGMSLNQVLREHPEYLGSHPGVEGELPLLIKFIDARKNLSVQVHPTDTYAQEHENGQLGKTEMWYVLDAAPGAQLICGFHHDMKKQQLFNSLADGTVEKYLQKVNIKKDDVFFIEAGTVHAIGAGALIAEIQESSNLTYRLYDYNRLDKNGRPRELHIDKALAVANLKGSAKPKQPLRLLKYKKGAAAELLCRCRYFQVERYLLNTESSRKLIRFQTDHSSFQVFLCLEGCGVVFMEDDDCLNFFKGDCLFVPADSMSMRFHGKAKFLNVRC
ncbi:MAG: class I mannose-6-phosphate isomerase [Lachnospiraceae bacterium]|nr:class I mannose-6-phosphate isomerase [Lachnospiraceae bacterium]